jgi:hypothetical protein
MKKHCMILKSNYIFSFIGNFISVLSVNYNFSFRFSLPSTLSALLKGLNEAGVEFVLVGGVAAVVQGAPVTT